MQKTKLGVSVGLLAAIIYFSGLISSLGLIILAGYVLLFEENEWLKRATVKALVLMIVFALAYGVLNVIEYVFGSLNGILSNFSAVSFRFSMPLNLDTIITYVLRFLERGLYIILGIKAFTQGTFKIGIVDRIVGKHFDAANAKQNMDSAQDRNAGFCPDCGLPLSPDRKFCGNCGATVTK